MKGRRVQGKPEQSGRLDRGDGVELAWSLLAGRAPTIVFLPGFASDMAGSKATALRDFAAATGQAMLRLDYSGHGASGGALAAGTIGRWMEDALAVIDRLAGPRFLLVGSSMGGWIALLVALRRAGRVAALVGIAAAPDFTAHMLTVAEQTALRAHDQILRPSAYGAPTLITRALIEDGNRHLLLDGPIPLARPVRLLQGQADPDVPWPTALRIAERLAGGDVQVILIKDGDHRLSRPQDLALLDRVVGSLLAQDGA
ncbi:MAG: alpha/beta hydrolase [Rhodospirillales bacterium]|nr:alpha/beta hydrolase [Rhodospirillales bacterium]